MLAGADPFHRFFRQGSVLYDSLRQSGGAYARLTRGLERSEFYNSGEQSERVRVRKDNRVTAFRNEWKNARLDWFTVDASELNACFYGFDAVTGPGGRVRIGVVVADSAQ